VNLIQRGTEFEDARADGFYGGGEGESGGLVEEEDDAVEFAFADAAGQREANGMEEIAAADAAGFLQIGGDFLKAFGGEGRGFENEQGEMTDDVAGGVTRDASLGTGRLQNLGGIVVEDGTQEVGEGGAVFGVVSEEMAGAFGPGEVLGGGSGG